MLKFNRQYIMQLIMAKRRYSFLEKFWDCELTDNSKPEYFGDNLSWGNQNMYFKRVKQCFKCIKRYMQLTWKYLLIKTNTNRNHYQKVKF